MDKTVTCDTRIKGGLPMRATGTIISCHPHEYPGRDYIEEVEIFWRSGHLYKKKVSDADMNKVVDDLFAEGRRG